MLAARQPKIDRIVARELRRLGVASRTKALAEVFGDEAVRAITTYYTDNCRRVLTESRGACGMIITGRDGQVLCADVYSSPSLFAKMFPQLIQSAALELHGRSGARKERSSPNAVKNFLRDLTEPQEWKRTGPQTQKLVSPTLVSQATLYADEDGTKVVHLEVYPRRQSR